MPVTILDDAGVRWLAGLQVPGLHALLRGLVRGSSWWVLFMLSLGLPLALLVLRRWRHLIVWLVAWNLGSFVIGLVAMTARRPRPFAVELQSSWGGWAMPSLPVAILTGTLIGVLYGLVPQGRWRNTGKGVAATLVAMVAVARIALGTDAPTDVLVAVGIGVTIPLLAFRRFAPNEVYPVTYHRGRSAHLDIGGARGQAIRRALLDQLGLTVKDIQPFGLSGSAGYTPCTCPWPATRRRSCSASSMPAATCAPTGGTSSAASCSTAAWRTKPNFRTPVRGGIGNAA